MRSASYSFLESFDEFRSVYVVEENSKINIKDINIINDI